MSTWTFVRKIALRGLIGLGLLAMPQVVYACVDSEDNPQPGDVSGGPQGSGNPHNPTNMTISITPESVDALLNGAQSLLQSSGCSTSTGALTELAALAQ